MWSSPRARQWESQGPRGGPGLLKKNEPIKAPGSQSAEKAASTRGLCHSGLEVEGREGLWAMPCNLPSQAGSVTASREGLARLLACRRQAGEAGGLRAGRRCGQSGCQCGAACAPTETHWEPADHKETTWKHGWLTPGGFCPYLANRMEPHTWAARGHLSSPASQRSSHLLPPAGRPAGHGCARQEAAAFPGNLRSGRGGQHSPGHSLLTLSQGSSPTTGSDHLCWSTKS